MAQRLTASQRRSLKREAAAWDQTGNANLVSLFDEGLPVRTRLRRPTGNSLIIALDERTLNRLQRAARRRQVEPRALAAKWVAERLAKEQSPSKHRA